MMKMLSLDDAIHAVTMLLDDENDIDKVWSCDVINNLKYAPSVMDAEPVRHGRWVNIGIDFEHAKDDETFYEWRCSVCNRGNVVYPINPTVKYCYECGAKMDEGKTDNE